MPDPTTDDSPEAVRRAVFRTLIDAQDAGASVAVSRADAAKRYGITEAEVRAIERAGIDGQWPPLGD